MLDPEPHIKQFISATLLVAVLWIRITFILIRIDNIIGLSGLILMLD
jgi:hypothetical protein